MIEGCGYNWGWLGTDRLSNLPATARHLDACFYRTPSQRMLHAVAPLHLPPGRMHQKDVANIIQALDKEEKVIIHQRWGMVSLAVRTAPAIPPSPFPNEIHVNRVWGFSKLL